MDKTLSKNPKKGTENEDQLCECDNCKIVKNFLLMSILLSFCRYSNHCKFSAFKRKTITIEKKVPSLKVLTLCHLLNRGKGEYLKNISQEYLLTGSFLCRVCYTHRPLEYKRKYTKNEVIHGGYKVELCEFCYPRKYSTHALNFLIEKFNSSDIRILVPAILKYPENLNKLIETCKKEIELYKRNNI